MRFWRRHPPIPALSRTGRGRSGRACLSSVAGEGGTRLGRAGRARGRWARAPLPAMGAVALVVATFLVGDRVFPPDLRRYEKASIGVSEREAGMLRAFR